MPPSTAGREARRHVQTMKTRILPLLAAVALLCSCAAQKSVQRHAWVTGLRPEEAERYRDLHAHPWPGVNRMIKACHIRNFSIHEREIDGRLYLFAYLEYTGHDFDADLKKMAADPETQRWWKETDPCQQPLPEAAAQGRIWSDAKEVYYLP
jgi:L-rhamnose mutarotase